MLEAGLFVAGKKKGEDEQAAGNLAAEALVAPFVEAEAALSKLRFPRCDAEPALAWLESKRCAMANAKEGGKRSRSGGAARADALEFVLLRARFSSVLSTEGPRAALRFVNERMAKFATQSSGSDPSDQTQRKRYLDEIQRLMGAVALFKFDGGGKKVEEEKEEEEESPSKRTRAATAAAAAAASTTPSSRRRKNEHRLPERYRDLFSRSLWDKAAEELAAAACELAGAPAKPPLLVAAAAGAAALPTLLKLANKMSAGGPGRTAAVVGGAGGASAAATAAGGGADGRASAADFGFGRDLGGDERRNGGDNEDNENDDDKKDGKDDDDAALPVDLNLGPEFAFTTIFSCPVSRDTATSDNPPMLLPCGHVFCRAAVSGISRGGPPSRAFKCPLCPTEATPGSCRALVFPPFGAVSGGGNGGESEEEEGKDDEAMVSD